jgi:hypothetical protein
MRVIPNVPLGAVINTEMSQLESVMVLGSIAAETSEESNYK